MSPSSLECAAELLEVVPLIMRAMRAEVRRHGAPELSMPQFRALAFLGRNEGATLTDVSAFLGLGLPSASKLIDALVDAQFVIREIAATDRRRVRLALSKAGQRKYDTIVAESRSFLADKVAHFSAPQRQHLRESLAALRLTFEPHSTAEIAPVETPRRRTARPIHGHESNGRPAPKKNPHV